MIIECPNCHSKYQYNEERFEKKPSKKIKCAKCATVFEIFNPSFSQQEQKSTTPPRADMTHAKREEPKPKQTTTEASAPQPATGKQAGLQLPPGKRLSLAVIDGPDAGNVFRIEKPRVTIGRAGADLNLNDTEASRQHAAVEIRDTIYTVNDLGSTNGTIMEGERITEPKELTDKGEFQIGSSTIMLIVTEDV
ncbi:MAG TPA: FHA domain-containing protein [Thermoanaerobaculia bacterium]|nr:FHA domain-containing protein [Thermoanaerobaculia bacterium]